MNKLFLIALLCLGLSGYGQTVFSETFNEADNSTTGSDAIGPTNWTALCPYSGAATDYLEVQSNVLEARDTNGPATWESDDFDVSACTEGITVSVDISETGNAEPVVCGGNCNEGDGIKFEVSYDSGSSWSAYSDATNGFIGTCTLMSGCGTTDCQGCGVCGSNAACELTNYPVPWGGATFDGPLIGTDDFTSSSFSDCASVGISSTIRLKLTFLCWAGTEYLFADNILAVCSSCALPVEIGFFDAKRELDKVDLSWRTLSEPDNKKFTIERSDDGVLFFPIGSVKGSMNSTGNIDYNFVDERPGNKKITYYRLEQMDMNGKRKYSEIKTVIFEPTEIYHDGYAIQINFDSPLNKSYNINIYNLSGAIVHTQTMSESGQINWDKKGFYFVEIPEIGVIQKLVVQ